MTEKKWRAFVGGGTHEMMQQPSLSFFLPFFGGGFEARFAGADAALVLLLGACCFCPRNRLTSLTIS